MKIERPGTGDPGRGVGGVDSDYFLMWNSINETVAELKVAKLISDKAA